MSALLPCVSKAAGPDGVSFILIKKLPTAALEKLLLFYNLVWRLGIYPTSWSESLIIPLLKPGKDSVLPSSYHPISLLNCTGKVLEKMANKRLFWHLEDKKILNSFQSGVGKKRSTIDNLDVLENKIAKGFASREHTVAVFLDIVKAYEMTWRHKIVMSLASFQVGGNMLKFISIFLNNRIMRVSCNGKLSDTFSIPNGIITGSSLSPVLFIVYLNDILDVIKPPLKRMLFIDDLVITARGKDAKTLSLRLQRALDDILVWSKQNGTVFSSDPGKSVCMHFSMLRQPLFAI